MKVELLLLISFLTLVSCATWRTPPNVTINLDLPPNERWAEVIKLKGETLKKKMPELLKGFDEKGGSTLRFLTEYMKKKARHQEYIREIEGIASATGISFYHLMSLNLFYELTGFGCTSMIVRDRDNNLWFGRNLDYLYPEIFGDLTISMTFVKGGRVLFVSEGIAGFVGAMTVMKPYEFAFSINQRGGASLNQVVSHLLQPEYPPNFFIIREVAERARNWAEAVDLLSTPKIAAPCYFTIAGRFDNQGIILELGFEGPEYATPLNNGWHLVKTNNDRNTYDPSKRLDAALMNLKNLGQDKIHQKNELMEMILDQYPTRNAGTIYSVVYCPNKGTREVRVWY